MGGVERRDTVCSSSHRDTLSASLRGADIMMAGEFSDTFSVLLQY